jgi:hypothetical protein
VKHPQLLPATALAAICCVGIAFGEAVGTDDLVGTSIGTDLLLDPTFGDAGSLVLPFEHATSYAPLRVVEDATGYWLLGSHSPFIGSSYEELVVVRLDANGNPDPAFGDGGSLIATTHLADVSDVALGGDGRFYAAGLRFEPNDALVGAVACIDADGAGCAGFGPDDGTVSVAVDGFDARQTPRLLFRDGSLFMVGATALSSSGNADTVLVAKLDAVTAAPDPGFGNGSPAPGEAILDVGQYPGGAITTDAAVFDGTRILVGGAAQSTDQNGSVGYVVAFDAADGAADAGFGVDGVATIALGSGTDRVEAKALAVRANRIAVAGNADLAASADRQLVLAELDPLGQPAFDFGNGGPKHLVVGHQTDVAALAFREDSSLVVAMTTLGLLPDGVSDSNQQSLAEFDAGGAGPVSTASIEFDGDAPPTISASFATALDIDETDRVVLAGTHYCGTIGVGTLISVCDAMTATRFVRDVVFASGFD